MTAPGEMDFYYEVDTFAVTRHFDIHEHTPTGKWIVQMIPEFLDGSKEQKLPPGQCVSLGGNGFVSDNPLPQEGWACRPWFLSHANAFHMAQEWLKKERRDLYDECVSEVRQARAWRAARAAGR